MVSPTNGIHKANSITVANQRTGTNFMTSDKAIEIIDAPIQGAEVIKRFSYVNYLI